MQKTKRTKEAEIFAELTCSVAEVQQVKRRGKQDEIGARNQAHTPW